MSHAASLFAVGLLFVAIIINALSLTQVWWEDTLTGPNGEKVKARMSLWNVNTKFMGAEDDTSWDDGCNQPSAKGTELGNQCASVKASRAFMIIGAVMAFCAAGGNAAGIATGNTLIDSAAGVAASFGSMFVAIGVGVGYLTGFKAVDGGGFFFGIIAGVLQLSGGIFGCVGTCQEMKELTALAATMHIGEFKAPEAYHARSERALKIRQGEFADQLEICANLDKRQRKAQEAAAREGSETGAPESEEGEKSPQKVPKALQRVLFFKSEDGDDDEIPTRMLEDAFAEIDGDGSGSIELDELVGSLRLCGLAVSQNATEVVMKEIDKNASGDVDLREFIEFFRHIEDLNRFQKKSAKRQQFMSFLLNFCFLADIVVVGVLLMMFIRADEAASPDTYAIMKNVLMVCAAFLGILFLAVILIPILKMALGPTVKKMGKQYELAQEIKKAQRMAMDKEEFDNGPRQAALYGPEDPPPPVNAALFGRSYRPGKVDSGAWAPPLEDLPPPRASDNTVKAIEGDRAATKGSQASQGRQASGPGKSSGGNKGKNWRYDPSNYRVAIEHAEMLESADLGPSGWAPMQMRDVNMPKQTNPAMLPGAPMALTDAAFPQSMNAR